MTKIPREIRAVIETNIPYGSSRRVVHEACSERGDAALSIKRVADGHVFHCFRCDFEGFIGHDRLPAAQIIKMIKEVSVPVVQELVDLDLPKDHIELMRRKDEQWVAANEVPIEAYTWCWEAGITDEMMAKYYFCYSKKYQRVIIPITDEETNLIGFVGRDYSYDKMRKQGNKYILRKQAGLTRRIYFTCHAVNTTTVVLVEDILSAIRVHEATGFETVALLNTNVGTDLMHEYMDYKMIVWLDNDQLANMVGVVARAQSFGIKATHLCTEQDPKGYNDVGIREMVNREEVN